MPNGKKFKSLEYVYRGNNAWFDLIRKARTNWDSCKFKKELLATLQRDESLAMVIYAQIGDDALNWINIKHAELNGVRAIDCLEGTARINRLREFLLRRSDEPNTPGT